jgi:hypothetical protein
MALTYNLISSVTLSGNASTISFTSIPQTFTDLLVKLSAKTNVNGDVDGIRVSINGTDTYPSGNSTRMYAADTTGYSNTSYNNIVMPGSGTGLTNSFGSADIYFGQYTLSGRQKLYLADSAFGKFADPYSFLMVGSGSNSNSDAITSISFGNFDSGGTAFVTGSSAYLYGIKKN